jgi:hypothetical protein
MNLFATLRTEASPRASRVRNCPVRVAGAMLAAVAALTQGAAGAQPISPAETLLFETDHLARLHAPATLVYHFRKVSNVEPGWSDKVQLDVANAKGKRSATLHFLSGKHKQDIPGLEEAHGNPVLLGFLEHDIAAMKRLTGGSTNYFRKRIRMALAEGAQVTPQSITWHGKAFQAQAVRIQPYLNDPLHARFETYIRKTYTFIVSEQVPGGLYQLRSSLGNPGAARPVAGTAQVAPAAPAAGAPAIDETLTLVSVTPAQRPASEGAGTPAQ